MATLAELRNERLRKLAELKDLGVNPYPATSKRTHTNTEVADGFSKLKDKKVTVVGRIVTLRKLGKLAFIVIRDANTHLQLFLQDGKVNKNPNFANSELGLNNINLLDIGDFVEASGPVIKTKTGEVSVEVHDLRLLTKSLRPMPSDYHGFSNKEERLRRRYIDMNVNKDVYDRFVRRSKFWQANRDYLNQNGFVEINTPVLEHTTGGADAKPFKTHMDAIDQDFYLRISQELPLKRLVGGGYEKVYDLGPRFRNENYTEEHLPEHIALEWYWAFADWKDGMRFMTDMFRYTYNKVYGKLKFTIHGHEVDFAKEWEEIDYAGIIKKHYDIDVFNTKLSEVQAQLKKHKLIVEKTDNMARSIDKLWKNLRKDIPGPAWLINTPLFISPLAKQNLDRPETVQRFQPIIGGSELGNGYSELNDPIDQLDRFLQQQKMRDAGDDEAQMLDIDFVEMLEYGMPPTCGWGHSERAFWMVEGVTAREGVPFPQLRNEVDQVTRSIYPEVKF